MAEQTLALLLGLVRQIPVFFRAQLRHEFERRPTDDLHARTIGIVGLGGNGRRIAQMLAPFRGQLLATDCFPGMETAVSSRRCGRRISWTGLLAGLRCRDPLRPAERPNARTHRPAALLR